MIDASQIAELDGFVLHLRSFDDDLGRAGLEGTVTRGIASLLGEVILSERTEEGETVAALGSAVRVIAAGRPGESLP
ncbi:hypothetical protein AB0C21_17460 [Spirillospora sp. NPDC049024]